jgi:hypoxanthine phosphoribosyltransferase
LETVGLPYEHTRFAHNAERQLARLLDFYAVRWEYEPHTFVLARGADGHPTSAFSPDFWLPDHDRYLEVTTLNQKLVTRKHRKLRRLRELHPEIDVSLVYQRDYLQLLVRFGLEPPEQLTDLEAPAPSGEPLGLLGLGTFPHRGATGIAGDSVA